MEIINNRRSVRQFQGKTVEPEKIDAMLKAAMQAPSAGNQQPWEFIVVQEKDRLQRISQFSQYAGCLKKVPLGIVLLVKNKNLRYEQFWPQDMGACSQNLLLEAVAQKLGAVWLGVAPEQDRINFLVKEFKLPEKIIPFAVMAIGYPKKENANHFMDRFDADRVHNETYGAE